MSHGGVRCFDEAMSADAISRTPALRPTVTTLGLPSSGPGDRPTIHRLVGLRPFSVSNIAQSPHGVGWPPARWLSQLALPAGAQPAVGHRPLGIIPWAAVHAVQAPTLWDHPPLRHAISMPPAPSREDLHGGDAPPWCVWCERAVLLHF